MHQRIHAVAGLPECPLLAISGHTAGTSRTSSALPLKADVAAVGRESPKLTHLGHWGRRAMHNETARQ
jgi:hypothetical protein